MGEGGNQKEGVREAGEVFITALLTFPLPHLRGGSDYNVIPFILPNTPGVYYWGDYWLLSDFYTIKHLKYHTYTKTLHIIYYTKGGREEGGGTMD